MYDSDGLSGSRVGKIRTVYKLKNMTKKTTWMLKDRLQHHLKTKHMWKLFFAVNSLKNRLFMRICWPWMNREWSVNDYFWAWKTIFGRERLLPQNTLKTMFFWQFLISNLNVHIVHLGSLSWVSAEGWPTLVPPTPCWVVIWMPFLNVQPKGLLVLRWWTQWTWMTPRWKALPVTGPAVQFVHGIIQHQVYTSEISVKMGVAHSITLVLNHTYCLDDQWGSPFWVFKKVVS